MLWQLAIAKDYYFIQSCLFKSTSKKPKLILWMPLQIVTHKVKYWTSNYNQHNIYTCISILLLGYFVAYWYIKDWDVELIWALGKWPIGVT